MQLDIKLNLPDAYSALFDSIWRFIVYYGGRGGGKSWAVADSLLILGTMSGLRILCARELQVSIADSVHRLLCDRIEALGLQAFYRITQKSIEGVNGTVFLFKGIRHNSTEIKSTEGVDICWCFPAGTLVDGRPIEILQEGDLVQSFNHATGKIELKPVIRVMKNICPPVLVKILTSHGCKPILCTSEHPVFIKNKGYTHASEIKSGDIVYEKIEFTVFGSMLGRLWRNYRNKFQRASRFIRKEGRGLLYGLREALVNGKFDKKQSNEQSCSSIKNVGSAEGYAQEGGCWKWSRDDKSAKRIIGKAWSRMVAGACCQNKKFSGSADKLQIGFGKCILYALHRMRWEWAQRTNFQRRRRKEKYILAERRVDRVEIQKQEDIGRNKRSDGGNYVYNIEVEGNNNYFADGVLVHNCEEAEKVSRNSWEVLIPTIRKEGSKIIVTFNTKNVTDATYERFILNKRDDTFVSKVSWRDNPFFPAVLDKERREMLARDPEAYAHIWEGEPDTRYSGGVYAIQMARAVADGRMRKGLYDPELLVHTAWDLGRKDSTAIWWWQKAGMEIRLIDYYENNLKDNIDHYLEQVYGRRIIVRSLNPVNGMVTGWVRGDVLPGAGHRSSYKYGKHYVPHDAANKLLAAGGRSIVQQAHALGVKMYVVASTSQQNGIEAARKTIDCSYFDEVRCAWGIRCLMNYHFPYDEDKQRFTDKPVHDWSSDGADAFEIIGQVWRNEVKEKEPEKPKFLHEATANELFWPENTVKRQERI